MSSTSSIVSRIPTRSSSRSQWVWIAECVAGSDRPGAATIAIWFAVLDVVSGRPLYTPTVLGTALFRDPSLALRLSA